MTIFNESEDPTLYPSYIPTLSPTEIPSEYPTIEPTLNPTAETAASLPTETNSNASRTIILVTTISFAVSFFIVLVVMMFKQVQIKRFRLAPAKRSYRGGRKGHRRRGSQGTDPDNDDNHSISSDTSKAQLLAKDRRSKVRDQGWQISYANEEYNDTPQINMSDFQVQPPRQDNSSHRPQFDPEDHVWSPNIQPRKDVYKYQQDNPFDEDSFSITL